MKFPPDFFHPRVFLWGVPTVDDPRAPDQDDLNERQFLDEFDVAQLMRCRRVDLARLRANRQGPPWLQVGRAVLYPKQQFFDWITRKSAANVDPPEMATTKAEREG